MHAREALSLDRECQPGVRLQPLDQLFPHSCTRRRNPARSVDFTQGYRGFAEYPDGRRAMLSVKGDKDPGYGSTSKMISETAIALCEIDGPGGVMTPGAALGEKLVERLQANAGLTFAVEG